MEQIRQNIIFYHLLFCIFMIMFYWFVNSKKTHGCIFEHIKHFDFPFHVDSIQTCQSSRQCEHIYKLLLKSADIGKCRTFQNCRLPYWSLPNHLLRLLKIEKNREQLAPLGTREPTNFQIREILLIFKISKITWCINLRKYYIEFVC